MVLHPIDYRYNVSDLETYLSNKTLLQDLLKVESAYTESLDELGIIGRMLLRNGTAKTLEDSKILSKKIASEISYNANLDHVSYDEWLSLDKVMRHDARAMVELLQNVISDMAKPYVHLCLTSNDPVDTAMNLMLRDAMVYVILPDSIKLENTLISLSRKYRDVSQIGRTHGQHAIPTTFGREIAVYVDRFGKRITRMRDEVDKLQGKISGAVGTRAAFKLLYNKPKEIEKLTLKKLDTKPVPISTQIIPKEYEADFYFSLVSAQGVISDLANDMRQLQRTEIDEVAEEFTDSQVGSSTMAQKRNPERFENIVGQYKTISSAFFPVLLNIISEHQRDMTDSAPRRSYFVEIPDLYDYSVRSMTHLMGTLCVNKEKMLKNIYLTEKRILAEPTYIEMALNGHIHAHDYIRRLTAIEKKDFDEILQDQLIKEAISKAPLEDQQIFDKPELYIGDSLEQVDDRTNYWELEMKNLEMELAKTNKN